MSTHCPICRKLFQSSKACVIPALASLHGTTLLKPAHVLLPVKLKFALILARAVNVNTNANIWKVPKNTAEMCIHYTCVCESWFGRKISRISQGTFTPISQNLTGTFGLFAIWFPTEYN